MDKSGLGIAVCMGDRGQGLEAANRVLDDYRLTINKYLGWVMEKPERIKEFENIYVISGEDFIDDKIIGAVSSILSGSLPKPEKPLIAYSTVEGEDIAKISARASDAVTSRGLNLGDIMQAAAEKFLGKGGGHNVAAGAQVSIKDIDSFVKTVNELVGKQLKGKTDGS
jgi:RecJ-like exonuclease